jgi:O-antigen/teichoic acid export membrane protein
LQNNELLIKSMSTELRIISGSSAAWARIGVTMLSQLALVPLYLAHWTVETYGIWLAVQALGNVLYTLDFGHQTFLEFEFLRIGKDNRKELSSYLSSGVFIGICLSIFQVLLIIIFLVSGMLPSLLGELHLVDQSLLHDAGMVLLLQGIVWLICTSMTGLFTRALAPFGYYPRMSWWEVLNAALSIFAPVVAVVLGADLLITSFVAAGAMIVCSCFQYFDIFHLLRREQITIGTPSLKLGWKNLLYSLIISGRNLLENIRQQGVRLILTPLSGAAGLAAFSTMRTGANVALQGMASVSNPLMPELMRFLHQRDQKRIDSAFGTVWIIVVALLAPAVVVLQAFIKPLYFIWTRGQVQFNPWLFAMLSQAVLVYALAQPAIAVIKGNNLLKPQFSITALAAIVVVGGMWILVPVAGILGAGVSLIIAEVIAATGYKIVASRWMMQAGLSWPKHPFLIVLNSLWISAAAMGSMIWLPQAKWFILIGSLLLLYWNVWRFWHVLPELATERARKMIFTVPIVKKLFAA